MKAGKMDRQITVERATVEDDGYGGEIETWASLCQPWAQISYGTGNERRVAAQESASLTATFRIRANPVTAAITTKDRIVFDGATWDVQSNVPYRRDGRDLTATRAA